MPVVEREVRDEAETLAFADALGRRLGRGVVYALHGDLGAGKTRFAQGLALGLGVREPVCSPTYALVNEHVGRDGVRFVHMDLYRATSPDDVLALGFEEYLDGSSVVVIEWPERAGNLLPLGTVHVRISGGATEDARTFRVAWGDDAG